MMDLRKGSGSSAMYTPCQGMRGCSKARGTDSAAISRDRGATLPAHPDQAVALRRRRICDPLVARDDSVEFARRRLWQETLKISSILFVILWTAVLLLRNPLNWAYPSPENQFFWTARAGVPGVDLARYCGLFDSCVSSHFKRLSPLVPRDLGQARVGIKAECVQKIKDCFLPS
jgi:hypothetical protein